MSSRARTRVPPKVIVLDADNTLWGGTLVDDGVGGLKCSDAFPGAAYRAFQIAAQRLRHRGVLLAIASKNDDEGVREAFAQVDGMVLTDADIAGRRVSWNPKPEGIAELADEFHLGLDAFVFVDDSPYEIGAVDTQLPAVRTLLVPEDVEELPDLLAESGLFRLMRVTDDDRERTLRMLAEGDRTRAATTMSHDEFLPRSSSASAGSTSATPSSGASRSSSTRRTSSTSRRCAAPRPRSRRCSTTRRPACWRSRSTTSSASTASSASSSPRSTWAGSSTRC